MTIRVAKEPSEEDQRDKLTPEEQEDADVGTAVAKAGIIALIVGIFLRIMMIFRGRKPKSK
ncbi:unnamed protein product [Orchesella dallaii]|uniref:Uncharacterized protein n=1 Tax=Orchesella dallaii TaxID=48710 RepID=A0ABP1R373_9HEXA